MGRVLNRSTDTAGRFERRAQRPSAADPLFETIVAGMEELAVFTLGPRGRVRTWNRGATLLTSYEATDAVGHRFPPFLADRARSEAENALPRAECVRKAWWRTREGLLRRVEERITPHHDATGRLTGWSVVARQVVGPADSIAAPDSSAVLERERELRAELEAAERRAAFLAEASSILVASSLSFDSTVRGLARLAVSRMADWCVVYARDDGGTLRCREVAHSDPTREERVRRITGSAVSDESPVASVVQRGRAMVLDEVDDAFLRSLFAMRGLDGAREFACRSAILTPLFGRGGSIGAVLFLSTTPDRPYDQDDLALAEELGRRTAIAIENARLYRAAQEANRAKADFLAIMSHELRTPLNAIMGYSDLLDAEISGPLEPKQRKQLWRVRASASHLLQLIDEILGFARMEAGVAEMRLHRIAGAELAREAAAVIEPMALSKGLELRVDAPDRSTLIETDIGKARQILVNLLSNAVKFTRAGVVEIAFRAERGRARFVVRDTGIGIPREQMERIFDPFWQVEKPTTRRFGGTGLGLSVSRRFARLLRGELIIGSEPGRGTTVTLELPLGTESDGRGR